MVFLRIYLISCRVQADQHALGLLNHIYLTERRHTQFRRVPALRRCTRADAPVGVSVKENPMERFSKFETRAQFALAAVPVIVGLTVAAPKVSRGSANAALEVSQREEVLYHLATASGDTLPIEP